MQYFIIFKGFVQRKKVNNLCLPTGPENGWTAAVRGLGQRFSVPLSAVRRLQVSFDAAGPAGGPDTCPFPPFQRRMIPRDLPLFCR
ncbi:MAG: hypothetical protein BAA03_14125 [Caldibacillus debilis]|nr:MAG: hypothetical protein BAA03_14125 [Caldibacillus debilis]